MYLLEYRYKWQVTPKSYAKFNSIDEIIDWLERFENNTHEDYIRLNDVNEIRITLKDSPIVFWIQLVREEKLMDCGHCYKQLGFKGTIITNDYPIGTLNSIKDTCTFLKMIIDFLYRRN